jgi:ribonuclease/clavin/mitogillin
MRIAIKNASHISITLRKMSSAAAYVVPEACRLEPIAKLTPRVWRVLGLNPSAMTLGGTNCYIVGSGANRILLDAGEGVPAWKGLLAQALRQIQEQDKLDEPVRLSQLLLTHWHYDHVRGIPQVRELFPDIVVRKAASRVVPVVPECAGAVVASPLVDGEVIRDDAGTVTITPLFTPGHSDDHMSFYCREERAIFTGDCVLGWGSSVFASYAPFMRSLGALQAFAQANADADGSAITLFPAHGPAVMQRGVEYMEKYIAHRTVRETQVWQAVNGISARKAAKAEQRENGEEEGKSRQPRGAQLSEIVDEVYGAALDPSLRVGAANNALHCLKKLRLEGKVAADASAAAAEQLLDPERDYMNDVHLARQANAGCGCDPAAQNAMLAAVQHFNWTPAS